MRGLAPLMEAFSGLEASLTPFPKDQEGRRTALRTLAAVNNQIGRLVSLDPSLAPRLRPLQLQINALTVSVKGYDLPSALKSLVAAKDLLLGLARNE